MLEAIVPQNEQEFMDRELGIHRVPEELKNIFYFLAKESGHTDPRSSAEQDEKVREWELQQEELRKNSWLDKVRESCIPVHLLPESGIFEPEYWPTAWKKAQRWELKAIRQGHGGNLLFNAKTGTGKSRMAAELAYNALKEGKTVYWLNLENFRNALEDGINSRERYQEALDMRLKAARAYLCVIDEIGKSDMKLQDGKTLSWCGRMLYEIVEKRRGRATIVTSEWDLRDGTIIARLTEAIVNRLEERAIKITNPPRLSFRQTQNRRNQQEFPLSEQTTENLGRNEVAV